MNASPGLDPADRFPIARERGDAALAVRCHPTLSAEVVERTIDAVREAVGRATR